MVSLAVGGLRYFERGMRPHEDKNGSELPQEKHFHAATPHNRASEI
jgi:hypothetical protein